MTPASTHEAASSNGMALGIPPARAGGLGSIIRWPGDSSFSVNASATPTRQQAVAFDGLHTQRLDADGGDFVDTPHEQVVNTLETARGFVAAVHTALQRE
jgi:hypothetical protein